MGVLNNLLLAQQLEWTLRTGDECEWYWMNIMVDTTLGVGVSALLLCLFAKRIVSKLGNEGAKDFKSGEYRDERTNQIVKAKYFKQLVVWLMVVSVMKVIMLLFMLIAQYPLQAFAGTVLQPFMNHPNFKLLVVMIVTPLIMNSLQFWLVDNIIRKKIAATYGADQPLSSFPQNDAE